MTSPRKDPTPRRAAPNSQYRQGLGTELPVPPRARTATLDDGKCVLPDQRWTVAGGELIETVLESGTTWSLRAQMSIGRYSGGELSWLSGNINHDGTLASSSLTWRAPAEAPCGADGCYTVRYVGHVEPGYESATCDQALADLGAEQAPITLVLTDDGEYGAGGNDHYFRQPGTCAYVANTGTGWQTWLDHDAHASRVVARVFPLNAQGGAVECHLRWDSDLTATTCP